MYVLRIGEVSCASEDGDRTDAQRRLLVHFVRSAQTEHERCQSRHSRDRVLLVLLKPSCFDLPDFFQAWPEAGAAAVISSVSCSVSWARQGLMEQDAPEGRSGAQAETRRA